MKERNVTSFKLPAAIMVQSISLANSCSCDNFETFTHTYRDATSLNQRQSAVCINITGFKGLAREMIDDFYILRIISMTPCSLIPHRCDKAICSKLSVVS